MNVHIDNSGYYVLPPSIDDFFSLGQSVIMVYTTYNRTRGESETDLVLEKIFSVSPVVRLFLEKFGIFCHIIMGREDNKFLKRINGF